MRLAPATAMQSVSEPSLMATIRVSSGTTYSLPGTGTGRRRPLSSRVPSEFLTHSMPTSRPSLVRMRTGAASGSMLTPSWSEASTSSSNAGISWRVRR